MVVGSASLEIALLLALVVALVTLVPLHVDAVDVSFVPLEVDVLLVLFCTPSRQKRLQSNIETSFSRTFC